MLPIVSLFVLVVFMGVIFADSVDAAIFVSSLNQSNASFGDVLGYVRRPDRMELYCKVVYFRVLMSMVMFFRELR